MKNLERCSTEEILCPEKCWMKNIRRSRKTYREILDERYRKIRVGDP
jgi:hypothetical protein